MMNYDYKPSLSHGEANADISKLGMKKANTKGWELLLLAVLAGLYIGFGGQAYLVAVAGGMGKVVGRDHVQRGPDSGSGCRSRVVYR